MPGPDATADLSRLTSAERSILELLADGHTAKSVSALTGFSINAVDERLREARRQDRLREQP